mgnify:CR=1
YFFQFNFKNKKIFYFLIFFHILIFFINHQTTIQVWTLEQTSARELEPEADEI